MAWLKDINVKVNGQDTGAVVENAYHFAHGVEFKFDRGFPKEAFVKLGAYLSKDNMQEGLAPLEDFVFSIMQPRLLELISMNKEDFIAHTGITEEALEAGLNNPVNLAFSIIARLIYLEALNTTDGPGVLKYKGAAWAE